MLSKTHCLYLIFSLFFSFLGISQNKKNTTVSNNYTSAPKTIYFTRDDFNSDSEFLTMCENEDGTLVFGNNDGALVFDGERWQKIYLPNNSPVNSLVKTDNGKIYAGGYNELGIIQKNKFGNYFYKSLISKFQLENKNLENLWQVHEFNNNIIYRSFSKLIVISRNRTTLLPSNKSFIYSEKVRDNYFVQDASFGLYKFDAKTMTLFLVFDDKEILSNAITSILPTPDPNIITLISKNGNVYSGNIVNKTIKKKINLFEGVKKDRVSYGIVGNNNNYIIGTRSSKIITLTNSGEIIRSNGQFSDIQNTTIHSLFKTKNENIWVLQANGLCFFDYKSPFIKVFDQASVYDILKKNKTIYVATSNGVYYSDFLISQKNNFHNFKKVEDLEGTSWAIQEMDKDIIISHDDGLFKLENGTAKKIGPQTGFWKISKINNKKGFYLGSTYSGLYLIEKKGNNWSIKHRIEGFDESTRDIIADYEPNTYWICHGNKGVYRIRINSDYSKIYSVDYFTNKNGFKSFLNINAFNWNKKIVFTTNTGIYTYNNNNNKFELFNPLNTILDSSLNTRKLIQNNEKTWFIQDDEAGYFIANKPKLYKDFFLNLKGSFNKGMESIYPLDNNTVLLGTNSGLFLYTLPKSQNKSILPTIISQIIYTKNQKKQFVDLDSKNNNIQLPNETDILRFEFASPKMFSSSETQYSYKLENADQYWSPWQKIAFKEYTHLRPGNYTFIVKSRTLTGLLGKETAFEFNILPKWYQTNLAYFIYIIAIAFFVYYIVNYVEREIALIKLKAEIKIKNSQQLLELEIEKNRLKQEKEEIEKNNSILEEDTLNKSKELINYALSFSKKKDMFDELKTDLKQLRELLKSEESRKKITEIFQKLNQHKIGKEYIELFDVNFEKVNSIFFERLKQIDPTLTQKELNICAFIKMNLTNKEIAPLINVSSRTIENVRYRLRKKLNIQREDNFISFLVNLAENHEKQ